MSIDLLHHESAQLRGRLRQALFDEALKLGGNGGDPGHGRWIFDCREMLLRQPNLSTAGHLMWRMIAPLAPTAVGGSTLGADPLVAAVLCEALGDGISLRGFIVRKARKTSGLRKLVEGPPLTPDDRVVLLDDLINSGRSLRHCVRAIATDGALVVGAASIVNFQAAGARWLADRGIGLHALFTLTDLGLAVRFPMQRSPLRVIWSAPLAAERIVLAGDGVLVDTGKDLVALDGDGAPRWHLPKVTHVAVAGAAVFTCDASTLRCAAYDTGEHRWELPLKAPPLALAATERYAATVTTDGRLSVFAAPDGRTVWSTDTVPHEPSPVALVNDRVWHVTPAGDVACADLADGRPLWSVRVRGVPKTLTPYRDRWVIVVQPGGYATVLGGGGTCRWTRRLGREIIAGPLPDGEALIVASRASVVRVDAESGRVCWLATPGSYIESLAATPAGPLVGLRDRGVLALSRTDGVPRWHHLEPAIRAGTVQAGGQRAAWASTARGDQVRVMALRDTTDD